VSLACDLQSINQGLYTVANEQTSRRIDLSSSSLVGAKPNQQMPRCSCCTTAVSIDSQQQFSAEFVAAVSRMFKICCSSPNGLLSKQDLDKWIVCCQAISLTESFASRLLWVIDNPSIHPSIHSSIHPSIDRLSRIGVFQHPNTRSHIWCKRSRRFLALWNALAAA
jgi:hypothetical protein